MDMADMSGTLTDIWFHSILKKIFARKSFEFYLRISYDLAQTGCFMKNICKRWED